MKLNQRGFGAVEALLILIIVGMIGGTGYYVWSTKNKTDNTYSQASKSATSTQSKSKKVSSDITSDWLAFTAPNRKYSMNIPDGWNLVSLGDGSAPYAVESESIIYKNGTKATIKPSTDKEIVTVAFAMGSPTFSGNEPNGEKVREYKTKTGLSVTQYKQEFLEDAPGAPKGSVEYEYMVKDGDKSLQIIYTQKPDTADQIRYIELAIETVKLN